MADRRGSAQCTVAGNGHRSGIPATQSCAKWPPAGRLSNATLQRLAACRVFVQRNGPEDGRPGVDRCCGAMTRGPPGGGENTWLGRVPHGSGNRPRERDGHEKLLRVEIVLARFVHDSDEASGRGTQIGDMLVQPAHQE